MSENGYADELWDLDGGSGEPVGAREEVTQERGAHVKIGRLDLAKVLDGCRGDVVLQDETSLGIIFEGSTEIGVSDIVDAVLPVELKVALLMEGPFLSEEAQKTLKVQFEGIPVPPLDEDESKRIPALMHRYQLIKIAFQAEGLELSGD